MSHKNPRIAEILPPLAGRDLDSRYLGFFECFNRQLFFEAHDVLEGLWLEQRGGPHDLFYKGLIQLAGAFVHVQKGRSGPASALFRLAQSNLVRYPAVYERLAVGEVLRQVEGWLKELPGDLSRLLGPGRNPCLRLEP